MEMYKITLSYRKKELVKNVGAERAHDIDINGHFLYEDLVKAFGTDKFKKVKYAIENVVKGQVNPDGDCAFGELRF